MYASEKQERGPAVGLFSFDREYVRRLAQGDAEIERHFVGYFEPLLLIKIRCRLRSGQDVLDLRQEVFLRVLKSLRGGSGVNDPACLGAFVNAVCNNVLLEYFRQHGKLTQIDKDTPEPLDGTAGGEQELLTEETRRNVRSLLNELPPKDREILQAVLIDERDKDHICRDCGVNRDYLRVLLHRARNRLRHLLADAGYRPEKRAPTSATYSQ
jgi:RNA polymerase sigma-70 factor (ECF subfamily)